MIRYLLAGLLLSGLALPLTWASSPKPQEGLWHAFEEEDRKSVFFLVVRDGQVNVYSPSWIPYDLEVELGDRIEFRLPAGLDGISIEGSYEEGRFQGKWHRPHPQFRIDGDWFAERVVASADYDPWEHLRSTEEESDLLDIASLLIEQEPPLGDFESFRNFWKKEIEARYYPLLTVGLYSDGAGEFKEELRKERVRQVYDYLRSRSEPFQKTVAALPGEFREVREDLESKFPWATFHRSVFTPAGGGFDFSIVALPVDGKRETFLLLGADWLEKETTGDQRRYTLARALLYQLIAVPQPRLGAEVGRRGIATWVAEQLEYSDRSEDLLFLSRTQWNQLKETLPGLCRKLKSIYYAPAGDYLKEYFLEGSRAGLVIGYAFAEAMSEGLKAEDMLKLEAHQMEERLQAFLTVQIGEGQPASVED